MSYASPYTTLEKLRDVLAAVPGVMTCKIGMEAGITPDDYPIVRIVPIKTEKSEFLDVIRQHECWVEFGMAIHEFDGLEDLYRELYAMEVRLINSLPRGGEWVARWVETVTDEDTGQAFKMMALRVLVDG